MSIISASTTLTTALQYTADTTGTLVFKTGATPTTALTLNADQSATFAGTVNFATAGFTNLSYTGTFTGGTGVIAIGTNQFYKDASGNIGIGTASPAFKLQVVGADAKFNTTSGSFAHYIETASTSGGNTASVRLKANTYNYGIYVPDNSNSMVFYDYGASAERMRIDSSGNVSIGTTGATGKFNVTVASSGTFQTSSYFTNSVDADIYTRIKTGVPDIGCTTSTPLTFSTASTERMRIDGSGNVGIGTSSPTSGFKLSVNGDFWQGNGGGVEIGRIYNEAGWYTILGSANVNGVTVSHPTTVRVATASTERMRIDSSGNLLVNSTTNPLGGKLYANGRLAARGLYIPVTPASGTAENFGEAWYSAFFVLGSSATITLWDNTAYYGTQFFEIFAQSDYGPRLTTWYRGQCSGYGGSVTALETNNGNVATFTIQNGVPAAGQCRVQMTNAVAQATNIQIWVKIHGTAASAGYVTSSYLALN